LGRCPGDAPGKVQIASLVVDPPRQRRGIGHRLLAWAVEAQGSGVMSVQTAAANAPALALYARFGFRIVREWTTEGDGIALVALSREPARTLIPPAGTGSGRA
jgi:ribosomal protein S18 acetylase RimI-like enzyme